MYACNELKLHIKCHDRTAPSQSPISQQKCQTEFKTVFPVHPIQQHPQVRLANMSIAVVEINYTFL